MEINENKVQWIPCSEKLPEDAKEVLITYVHDYNKTCPEELRRSLEKEMSIVNAKQVWEIPMVTIALHFDGDDESDPQWTFPDTDCTPLPDMVNVLAWTPLPDPWRGENND